MFKVLIACVMAFIAIMSDMGVDDLLLCILVMLIGIWAEIGGEE